VIVRLCIRGTPAKLLMGDIPKFTEYRVRPDGTWGTGMSAGGGMTPSEFSAFLRAKYR
jgi:hypothetical protein